MKKLFIAVSVKHFKNSISKFLRLVLSVFESQFRGFVLQHDDLWILDIFLDNDDKKYVIQKFV